MLARLLLLPTPALSHVWALALLAAFACGSALAEPQPHGSPAPTPSQAPAGPGFIPIGADEEDDEAVVVEVVEEAVAQDAGRGVASYYGRRFAGRSTASGETFVPSKLTAAHRTLPFGTRLRVTNLDNGKQVTVRVNDRGPFVHGRVLDLSRGAAEVIGMVRRGTARVRMEIVRRERVRRLVAPPPAPLDPLPVEQLDLQRDVERADRMR